MLETDFPRALRAAQTHDEADDGLRELRRVAGSTLERYLRITAPDIADDVGAVTWSTVERGLRYFSGGEGAFRRLLVRIAREEVAARRRGDPSDSQAIVDLVRLDGRRRGGLPIRASGPPSAERVLRLVAALPPNVAEMVTLRMVVGMDAAQTAALVGNRPGFVIVAVHGGLRRILGELAAVSGSPTAMLPNPWELDRLLDSLARHGRDDLAVLDATVREVVLALRPEEVVAD